MLNTEDVSFLSCLFRHGDVAFLSQEPAMTVAITRQCAAPRKRMDPCGFASWEEPRSRGLAEWTEDDRGFSEMAMVIGYNW